MKKFLSLILVVALIAAMAIPAMADGYTITVDNAVNGETYTAYKILDATYEGEDVALSGTDAVAYYYAGAATDELYVILAKYFQFDAFVDGKAYVKVVDASGNKIDYSTVDVAAMAKEISALTLSGGTSAVAADGKATISVPAKGYYFVDTSLGSFCSIDTAAKVTIYEKNTVPTLTKEVQEDSTEVWGATATADMGQTVNFRLTVKTGTNTHTPGTDKLTGSDKDYVITDTLPSGMTYMDNLAIEGWNTDDYSVDYTGDVLTITLKAAKVATLGQNATVVITYGARVDTDAVVAGEGNTNTAFLTYSEQKTTEVKATVFTYKFDILKQDGTTKAVLQGVKFTLTKTENNVTSYYVASENNSSVWTDTKAEVVTGADGKVSFVGLDAGTYTLTETETKNGYNLLDAPITVTIAEDGTVTAAGYADGVITIDNFSGTVLPSTGGHGVYWFYGIGGALIVGAVVLLITKKRMSKEQ